MKDYEPIDLASWCNVGPEVLGDDDVPEVGRVLLRGLPFLVSADGARGTARFVALRGDGPTVTIPVGRPAHRVVFAHRLLESSLAEGGPLGIVAAQYVFHMAGGSTVRVPIRERFEITALPGRGGLTGRAGMPFLAVSDQGSTPMPRYRGKWDQVGRRQWEALPGSPRWYYLWAWKNPDPGSTIESLEVVPAGPRFIIAGVTLGHVDEHPLVAGGGRPARIILSDAENAKKPFDLNVTVDRGEVTYAYPLPTASDDDFLGDPFKGWGQEPSVNSSPSYVEVSATPSASLTVAQGDVELGRVRWGEVQRSGSAETPRMRVELIDPGKNWVHVTVLDEGTGRPVPCRIHFRSPQGVPYQPYGYHNHVHSDLGTWYNDVGGDVRLGQITYAYIDGTCQGWLPRGEVIVDIARGFEYEPLRTRVAIEPGQRELTLRIRRWTNMNQRRWFSGDSHVHWLSTQGALTEARGEDLNVVNVLQSQWGNHFTNVEDFAGEPTVSNDGQTIVYVGQENRQRFMGHLLLWGLKSPVMPWCSDGLHESEVGGTLETTLTDWADMAHEQGGTVIAAHYGGLTGEAVALIASGRVDGIDMNSHSQTNHDHYYQALNCGYRLPLVGGTDKMSSDVPVGGYRTYVYIPEDEEFGYDSWCRNVAKGRTFLSGGPMIELSVDGEPIGSTLSLSSPGTVEAHARAESIFPLHRLELIQEGRVVASAESRDGSRSLELKENLKVSGHT